MLQIIEPKTWRKVKLGDLFRIKHGFAFKGEFFSNKGKYILLTPGNFSERSGLMLKGEKEKYYTGKIPNSYILEKGDLLVVMTDILQTAPYLGAPAVIDKDDAYLHNQRLGLIYDLRDKKISKKFLYWIFQSANVRSQIKESASGSTVKHTSPEKIYTCEISIPEDINEQKRIAEILSAFDDKIELNNKINQNLEQTAQAIFKEWFVRFKFLGHEKVKMVDSELGKIPKEWRVIDLYNYVEFEGGSQPPKEMHIYEKRNGYVRFIQNRDYDSDVHMTYIPESKRNKVCDKYDIMMDKYGEAGKVRFSLTGAYNVALAKITPRSPLMREYLRWFLKQPHIQQLIEASAVASTRASVNKIVFKNLKALLPPIEFMEKFENIGKLYIDNYLKLKKENQTLSSLRDLLLPKLMSGEIRV